MATTLARKFFSQRITMPSNQALSLYQMMQLAPATATEPVWGQNSDGSPSMDSSWGDGATIIPVSQPLFVGRSADVTATNGVPVAAGVPYGLSDYSGIVDSEQVWCYSVNSQSVDLVFQGR